MTRAAVVLPSVSGGNKKRNVSFFVFLGNKKERENVGKQFEYGPQYMPPPSGEKN
jgi:hypothetical protein